MPTFLTFRLIFDSTHTFLTQVDAPKTETCQSEVDVGPCEVYMPTGFGKKNLEKKNTQENGC